MAGPVKIKKSLPANRPTRPGALKAGALKEGLVDLHTHGLGPYGTREAKNSGMILGLAALHGKKGAALIYPTIYPAELSAMRARMAAVKEAMNKGARGAFIGGINLEGPFLNPARCGALGAENFLKPTLSNLKRLIGGFEDVVKIITVAPEMPGALKVMERCAALGIKVNMGHSDATARQAREGKSAGASGVTHLFNAMRPFHHREAGLAGFALLDPDLYVEIIADGVHLGPEALALVLKVKNPEKIILVSDSVRGGRGRPVYEGGILAGGGKTVSECLRTLKGLSPEMDERLPGIFARENPLRYVGLI